MFVGGLRKDQIQPTKQCAVFLEGAMICESYNEEKGGKIDETRYGPSGVLLDYTLCDVFFISLYVA